MRLDFVESRWQDRPPDCRLANQITHQEQKREHKLMLVPGPNKCFVWNDGCLTFLHQVLSWSGQLFPQLWIAARHWNRLWNEIKLGGLGDRAKSGVQWTFGWVPDQIEISLLAGRFVILSQVSGEKRKERKKPREYISNKCAKLKCSAWAC